jgi:hypothetical protein
MAEFDTRQVMTALTAAKNMAAIREERFRLPAPRQEDFLERARKLANNRAAEGMLASSFTKAGFEPNKFDEIISQNYVSLRHSIERQKAEAVRRSSYVKRMLRYGVEGKRKALEHLLSLAPPVSPPFSPTGYELLDAPFLIWPTQGIFFDSSHYEPWNSWGKIKFDSSKENGGEELSFYFLWSNPSEGYSVINVDAYLILNGFCSVETGGGFFAGDRQSSLTLSSRLYLLEWWNQPPTSPLMQTDQFQNALHLYAEAGGTFDFDGDFDGQYIYRGYDLRYTLFLIPPHETVVFEVALNISYYNGADGGQVHVDFASGDFEVMSPAVLVATLS